MFSNGRLKQGMRTFCQFFIALVATCEHSAGNLIIVKRARKLWALFCCILPAATKLDEGKMDKSRRILKLAAFFVFQ